MDPPLINGHYLDFNHDGGVLNSFNLGSYTYCRGNPIKYFDPDGNQYVSGLIITPEGSDYKFTKSAAHLLHLVSGVDKVSIENTIIKKKSGTRPIPFYSSDGAITLGSSSKKASITYTPDWFDDKKRGSDVTGWLDISSHEVGHLPQIDKEGGLGSYLLEFVKQYATAGEHDGAPYEKEAQKGSEVFRGFIKGDNKNKIEGIFENTNTSQDEKIEQINTLWETHQESINTTNTDEN